MLIRKKMSKIFDLNLEQSKENSVKNKINNLFSYIIGNFEDEIDNPKIKIKYSYNNVSHIFSFLVEKYEIGEDGIEFTFKYIPTKKTPGCLLNFSINVSNFKISDFEIKWIKSQTIKTSYVGLPGFF